MEPSETAKGVKKTTESAENTRNSDIFPCFSVYSVVSSRFGRRFPQQTPDSRPSAYFAFAPSFFPSV
jgi:hypothetical protein